jgi:hypothetical protein
MTREEFQKKIDEEFGLTRWPNGYSQEATKKEQSFNLFEIEWRTGGVTGGNCWGDEANEPVDADQEPEFDDLNRALELFAPNITYLHYRTLASQFEMDERCQSEYYGNCYYYAIKRITLDVLYLFLKDRKYI